MYCTEPVLFLKSFKSRHVIHLTEKLAEHCNLEPKGNNLV